MPRLVDLSVTRYDWVPGAAGLTTPSSPKVTELVAGTVKAISAYVVTTTQLNPTASDTITEKGITDTNNAVVPTINNFEGHLDLFRDYTTGAPTANDPLTTIGSASGVVGWIVRRYGLPASTAWAVGQKIDVFYVMTDAPQQSGGQADGYLKVVIPLLQQGQMYLAATAQA
jgi:hypothetical protein